VPDSGFLYTDIDFCMSQILDLMKEKAKADGHGMVKGPTAHESWGEMWGACGLHADSNDAEKTLHSINRLYSGLDAKTTGKSSYLISCRCTDCKFNLFTRPASTAGPRSAAIKGLKEKSLQAKFFSAVSDISKLKGVSKRMLNRVELDHLRATKPGAAKTHDFKSKPVEFR
jgi:hypothetical protein